MRRVTRVLLVTLILSITLFVTVSVVALAGNPPTYFTDNMASTGTSPNVTVMEQQLLDRINGATTTIEAAFYDFNRNSIRDALIAAHGRGVTVRIVTDDEARYEIDSYVPYYQALETAGISIQDDGLAASIMHNKYFVIDGEIVWSGSTNLSDNGFTKNHNNAIVFTSTVLADIYQADFEQMWAGNFSTSKTASVSSTVDYEGIPLEIYFSPKDDAIDEVIAEVNAATTSVEFAIFFFTDDDLRDALIAAHNRGVEIRGLWDLLGASNGYSDDEALCDAGIPIKIEDTIGKMHNKFMVIDAAGADPRVVTGSMNWSGSGNTRNDENTLIVHDLETAQAYTTAFADMWEALDASTQCGAVVITPTYTNTIYLPLLQNSGDPVVVPTADVQLSSIIYNPDGDDVLGEFVVLENKGDAAQDMSGWTLMDEAEHTFTFPNFTLSAGTQVTVWVRSGTNTTTDLYWGRGSSVWNNTGDIATLRDGTAAVVDVCAYEGGGVSASCDGSEPPPPPPPPDSDVRLNLIVYNPEGSDVDGEYVELINVGLVAQDMTAWKLIDAVDTTYTFPAFTLKSGATVRVWTGTGTDTPTDLYWDRGSSVWTNTGDTAYLRDSFNALIDSCTYTGGGVQASCN